jgi:hypothetical protein
MAPFSVPHAHDVVTGQVDVRLTDSTGTPTLVVTTGVVQLHAHAVILHALRCPNVPHTRPSRRTQRHPLMTSAAPKTVRRRARRG